MLNNLFFQSHNTKNQPLINIKNAKNLYQALQKISSHHALLPKFVNQLTTQEISMLLDDWSLWAHPYQKPPPGHWVTWLVIGGRGSGKTRAGAEWIKAAALGRQPFFTKPVGHIALIGETFIDARNVMIEGISGLLAIHTQQDRPIWSPSLRRLEWPNGITAHVFSAEDPEAIRGSQFAIAWSDEIAKWRFGQETWDMLQFALRLGENPRQIATTTPRSVPLIHRLMHEKNTIITRGATKLNKDNLAPLFLEQIVHRYQGSRLGRQELDGELIEDNIHALFKRPDIDRMRVDTAPPQSRIVVAIDPPASSQRNSNACGIIAAGIGEDKKCYVLQDATLKEAQPMIWAERAISVYRALNADCLIVETNQGGEMATTIIRNISSSIPIRTVHATRSKFLRAEPVAALYAQGRVCHVGSLQELEDEMCTFCLPGPENIKQKNSPDRLDALVWAITTLALNNEKPRLTRL